MFLNNHKVNQIREISKKLNLASKSTIQRKLVARKRYKKRLSPSVTKYKRIKYQYFWQRHKHFDRNDYLAITARLRRISNNTIISKLLKVRYLL